MTFPLNSQAQGVSGKYEQSTQTPWRGAPEARRGAQCSCIGCIGLRSALAVIISGMTVVEASLTP